jgi:hypothetical protein
LRRSLENLGVEVAGALCSEVDPLAIRIVSHHWPGTIHGGAVEEIDHEKVENLLRQVPHCKYLLVAAGSPCQDLSGANPGGQGLGGARSALAWEVMHLFKVIARYGLHRNLTVAWLLENVASMDSHGSASREAISKELGCVPYKLCSSQFTWCKRPRFYWTSYQVQSCRHYEVIPKKGFKEIRLLTPDRGPLPELDGRARRTAEGAGTPFCTFLRGRRSAEPGWRPSGLDRVDESALARWRADGHRFPPYQYQLKYMIVEKDMLRPLSANEREVLLGLPRGHTLDPLPAAVRRDKVLCEDLRCKLLGNAFSCPAVSLVVGPWLASLGLLKEVPGPSQCRGELAAEDMKMMKELGGDVGGEKAAKAATLFYHRVMSFKGSDVRLGLGVLTDPSVYPRKSIEARRWRWRVAMAWKMSGAHINALELVACHAAAKWRCRRAGGSACGLGKRVVHLTDSQVCQGVLSKGRSSSKVLQRILKRHAALILGSSMVPGYVWVRTADNPADAPSRYREWGGK